MMARRGEAAASAAADTRRMTTIDVLSTRRDGTLHLPGDPQYAETGTLFNAAIDRRPAMIIRCASVADVAAAICHARDHDLPLAVRGGGHSVSGASLCDGGVVLDMRRMDAVTVDPVARAATVGGGCLSGRFDRATQAHELATTSGRVSTTGVAGFTLGWRIRLARTAARVRMRQPAVRGGRHRRRSALGGRRGHAQRPVLGAEGRRRQLRCRDLDDIPAPSGRADRSCRNWSPTACVTAVCRPARS
jgi:hypothetical protein